MEGGSGAQRTADGCFHAPLVVAYPYSRTVGTTLAHFFTELTEGRLAGTVGSDGKVWCPPAEFDPHSGEAMTRWAAVADTGTVTTWAWEAAPAEGHPLDAPFAWALIRLDGSDGELLHAVAAPGAAAMRTGMRVAARWRAERGQGIADIVCFDPCGDDRVPASDGDG